MEGKNKILIIGVDKEIHTSITKHFDTSNFECVCVVHGKEGLTKIREARFDIIILDEPTSALDMNTQLQIIQLLLKLQISKKLSYIFISHDLKVIKALADNILIMKDGQILEEGDTNTVLNKPKNKYTKSLLQSSLN